MDTGTGDLFHEQARAWSEAEAIADSAVMLRGFARRHERQLLEAIARVTAEAPLRHLSTPGGYGMSVAMSNCGPLGWISDRQGYRYTATDPETGQPWPGMPAIFHRLATAAAEAAGFGAFTPQACLINRYRPGSRLSLHQDRDEEDLDAPIVSVSLGVPAVFLFGGRARRERPRRLPIHHGDVAVWGGSSRLNYHGIASLKETWHPLTGKERFNLTFRRVYPYEIHI